MGIVCGSSSQAKQKLSLAAVFLEFEAWCVCSEHTSNFDFHLTTILSSLKRMNRSIVWFYKEISCLVKIPHTGQVFAEARLRFVKWRYVFPGDSRNLLLVPERFIFPHKSEDFSYNITMECVGRAVRLSIIKFWCWLRGKNLIDDSVWLSTQNVSSSQTRGNTCTPIPWKLGIETTAFVFKLNGIFWRGIEKPNPVDIFILKYVNILPKLGRQNGKRERSAKMPIKKSRIQFCQIKIYFSSVFSELSFKSSLSRKIRAVFVIAAKAK